MMMSFAAPYFQRIWDGDVSVSLVLRAGVVTFIMVVATQSGTAQNSYSETRWLAGDHHIHSRFSVAKDESTDPPKLTIGGMVKYAIPTNALMAKHFGLDWMVSTDHGEPNHAKINLEHAYPELLQSRKSVPEVIQFYGMEFNAPDAAHVSLIIPHSDHEHEMLYEIQSRYDSFEKFPREPPRTSEEWMIEALKFMRTFTLPPVLFVNHPARSATALGVYGRNDPAELRNWKDAAPDLVVGMEGAPGHQADALNRDGSIDPEGVRGANYDYPTMGGYDQMTARLGGFWDSILGEGRRWWVTATSDLHRNWREGGRDFWPGEYAKTYVFGERNYDSILEGLRSGRVFVTTGDLINELYVTADAGGSRASIGGTLNIGGSSDVTVTIRLRDPAGLNHHRTNPTVERVDLIVGQIMGPIDDFSQDTNPTTHVARRFTSGDWTRDGEYVTMTHMLEDVHHSAYIRVRGTNTNELEPETDPLGEDPWSDLWFYSNPIFIEIE